jgi:uncharacterized membrane protein
MPNFHPQFVHFPIALFSAGLLCDLLGSVLKRESLRNAGWWCQVLGMAGIAGAIVTGLHAESTVVHDEASHGIMETHERLAFAAAGIFALLFVWRSCKKTLLPKRPLLWVIYFVVGAVALGVVFYTAHLGGRLVYEFGIGVATQSGDAGYQVVCNHCGLNMLVTDPNQECYVCPCGLTAAECAPDQLRGVPNEGASVPSAGDGPETQGENGAHEGDGEHVH